MADVLKLPSTNYHKYGKRNH